MIFFWPFVPKLGNKLQRFRRNYFLFLTILSENFPTNFVRTNFSHANLSPSPLKQTQGEKFRSKDGWFPSSFGQLPEFCTGTLCRRLKNTRENFRNPLVLFEDEINPQIPEIAWHGGGEAFLKLVSLHVNRNRK